LQRRVADLEPRVRARRRRIAPGATSTNVRGSVGRRAGSRVSVAAAWLAGSRATLATSSIGFLRNTCTLATVPSPLTATWST
jgi:hypothetical protein